MFSATEIQEMPKNNKAYSWYMVAKLKHCIQLTDVWSILVKEMINIAFSLLENGKHCILLKRKLRTLHSLYLKMANMSCSWHQNVQHWILLNWKMANGKIWPVEWHMPDVQRYSLAFIFYIIYLSSMNKNPVE